ncbi:hypothetical protein SLEP1_g38606 [Rubroshorea leprosula]|uniref:Uncharacterized protein n=1 Tax=Rubroshorea leprosula TaxID=152421 RepID=A0AAV5KXX5_9ROSI|nr:hypothetical protein SLEP1_g38606 [Rubroshorea leprosula]
MKKARQGSCWVIAGAGFDAGFDFSISNLPAARFLQVLGSKSNPTGGEFHFKPSSCWVCGTQRVLGLSSRCVPASEALGFVSNPAAVGSSIY